MEANAPEKIYIHVRANKELGTTWHGKKITNGDIEYTRADAFLKKAKLWLTEIHRVCDITDEHGYRIDLRELQARFENYMKGE